MDQAIRNKLRGVVTQCRKLLEDSTAQALQGRFGIYAASKKGEVQIEDESRMAHLTEEDRACRQDLLDHLEHIQAIGYKPSETLEQLVREIAFTHLNRLCAYKMMEARGLIREAVSRGLKSQGFFFYLADHPGDEKLRKNGQQEVAYRNFLDWLGGTLSEEIGVLFNPDDPANRIYPPQRVLDDVLALINDAELKDIWSQDETIGWVYQYFTPKELRDKARKESQTPRNSYELAFRNQFFTPRYVVEFLTDNTLGRIWYEMRRGETVLKDRCRYLVRRLTEVFLREGEAPPAESKGAREALSQEELLKQPVYISHRPKKDPREIRILDPACGSGHFLLYCFDLLQVIYVEAYDDPDLGAALKRDYPAIDDLRRAVPGLILKRNLHGIDIDLRATQIAALALWLRCQRAYQELGLKNGERPKITRSNIVCAEPMPGETDLLKEFTSTLQPKVLGQLVEAAFKKMKLAGEAGSLLKIEEEIREAAMTAKKEYQEELRRQKEQAGYLPGMAPPRERTLFDFSDMTDSDFLDRAEEELVAALRQYAEMTSNGKAFRRRLFAEDAARGFSFVDVCSKKYDVVLMNPPFGSSTETGSEYLQDRYKKSFYDLAATFIEMASARMTIGGRLGAIANRTIYYSKRLSDFRRRMLREKEFASFIDLGSGVLDALVETALTVVGNQAPRGETLFADCTQDEHKDFGLLLHLEGSRPWLTKRQERFTSGNAELSYKADSSVDELGKPVIESGFEVRQGLASGDNFRFVRLRWEVLYSEISRRWFTYSKGGDYAPFYYDLHLLVDWGQNAQQTYRERTTQFSCLITKNSRKYAFRPGLTYATRTTSRLSVRVMHVGCLFDTKGSAIFSDSVHKAEDEPSSLLWLACALNSDLYQSVIDSRSGALDSAARSYSEGLIGSLPFRQVSAEHAESYVARALSIIRGLQSVYTLQEPSALFVKPIAESNRRVEQISQELTAFATQVWNIAKGLRGDVGLQRTLLGTAGSAETIREISDAVALRYGEAVHESLVADEKQTAAAGIVSYLMGCALGRWDIRFAAGERQPPELPDPFDPLPVCAPGMLQGPDGLPAKPECHWARQNQPPMGA